MKKEKEKDVFKEALEHLNKSKHIPDLPPVEVEIITPEEIKDITEGIEVLTDKNIDLPMNSMTDEQKSTWDDLQNAMIGEHAKKFNEILTKLPDREFVRVYLKTLEFFMPKVTRREGEAGRARDMTINVQINRGNLKE